MRIVILIILFPIFVAAQTTSDGTRFITHALVLADTSLEVKSTESAYFPWIEEYEFRTETRDLDFEKQEYVMRLSPSTSEKRKAQARLYSLLQSSPNFDLRKSFCDRSIEVHAHWISLYIIDNQLEQLSALEKNLDDKSRVYEKYIGIYEFDFQKLVSIEQIRTDLNLKKYSLENERKFILSKYNLDPQIFDYSQFIGTQEITEAITTLDLYINNEDVIEDAYKMDMIQAEIALEEAEDNQILDFVQLRYQGPHDNLFKERFSVGMGVRLPNNGNRILKMKELELEFNEILDERVLDQQESQLELQQIKEELRRDIAVLAYYDDQIKKERLKLQSLTEKITAEEGYNPISILNIEERAISNGIDRIQMLEEILFDYLNYLKRSGQICGSELRNFFEKP